MSNFLSVLLLLFQRKFFGTISEINCYTLRYSPAKSVAFIHSLHDFLAKQVDYMEYN